MDAASGRPADPANDSGSPIWPGSNSSSQMGASATFGLLRHVVGRGARRRLIEELGTADLGRLRRGGSPGPHTASTRNTAIRSAAAATASGVGASASPFVTYRLATLGGEVVTISRNSGRRSSTGTSISRTVELRRPRVNVTVSAARALATQAAFGNAWTM